MEHIRGIYDIKNVPEEIFLEIHSVSLHFFISAVAMAILALYSLIYLFITRRDYIILAICCMEIAFCVTLFSYGMFKSSVDSSAHMFWSRIFYTGIMLSILIYSYFMQRLVLKKNMVVFGINIIVFIFWTIVLWYGELVITGEVLMNLRSFSPHIEKGVLFKYFIICILAFAAVTSVMFVRGYVLKILDKQKHWPLFYGSILVMLIAAGGNIYFITPLSAITIKILTMVGVLVIVFVLGLYQGNLIKSYTQHLDIALREKEQLQQKMIIDDLTGVYNRSFLINIFKKKFNVDFYENRNHCLLYIDIDRFKSVNDILGHNTGDRLLKAMGEILKKLSRKEDTPIRIGGDEFILFCKNCDVEDAKIVAGRIQSEYREIVKQLTKEELDFSYNDTGLSIGICPSEYWGKNMQTAIEKADKTMYIAKKKRMNFIEVYENR